METVRRKGSEAGLSIGVTPGARNLNSKKRYVPSRGDKDTETESYTRKTHIATGTTLLSWLKRKKARVAPEPCVLRIIADMPPLGNISRFGYAVLSVMAVQFNQLLRYM